MLFFYGLRYLKINMENEIDDLQKMKSVNLFQVKNTHASRSAENENAFTEERIQYLTGIAKTVQFNDMNMR